MPPAANQPDVVQAETEQDQTPAPEDTDEGSGPPAQPASAAPTPTNQSTTKNTGWTPPEGSGLKTAVDAGAVNLTNVKAGERYNGVEVPSGAVATDGQHWFNEGGSILTDTNRSPTGQLNKYSSDYISQWNNNMLANGVPPDVASELIEPYMKNANALKDFQNMNSDAILRQKGLMLDNAKKGNDLINEIGNNVSEATTKYGAGAGALAMNGAVGMLGGPQKVAQLLPGFQGTPQSTQQDLQMFLARGASAATKQQQELATLAETKIRTQKDMTDAYTTENASYNSTSFLKQNLDQARGIVQQYLSLAQKGGGQFADVNDLLNYWKGDQAAYGSLKEALTMLQGTELKAIVGAGNRLGQTEVKTWGSSLADGSMPMETLKWTLGNASNYAGSQLSLSQNKLNAYRGIAAKNGYAVPGQVAPPTNVPAPPVEVENPKTEAPLKMGDVTRVGVFLGGDWSNPSNYKPMSAAQSAEAGGRSGMINRGGQVVGQLQPQNGKNYTYQEVFGQNPPYTTKERAAASVGVGAEKGVEKVEKLGGGVLGGLASRLIP